MSIVSEDPKNATIRAQEGKIADLEAKLSEAIVEGADCRAARDEALIESASAFDAINDRHDRFCGPQFGQPIHCCPDPICRAAYVATKGRA